MISYDSDASDASPPREHSEREFTESERCKRLQTFTNCKLEEVTIPISFRIPASIYILYKNLNREKKRIIRHILIEGISNLAKIEKIDVQQTVININMPVSLAIANADSGRVHSPARSSAGVEEDVSLLKERVAVLKEQLREAKELLKYYREKADTYRRALRIISNAAVRRDLKTIKSVLNKLGIK